MNDHDDVLERSLRSLERSLPVTAEGLDRPSQHRRPRRLRWTSPIVSVVALVALAGGATGSAVVSEAVRGHPGLDRTAGTSTQTTTAPEDGYVIEGVVKGRALLLVVETGEAAIPVPSGCESAAP